MGWEAKGKSGVGPRGRIGLWIAAGILAAAILCAGAWLLLRHSPRLQVVNLNRIGFLWQDDLNSDSNRTHDLYRVPPSKITGPKTKRAVALFRNGQRMYPGYDPKEPNPQDPLNHYFWWDWQEGLGLFVPIPKGADPADWFAKNTYELRYGASRKRKSGQFDVVMTIYDACRPDHLSCYGYGRPTTPELDSIAAKGVVFRQAISQGGWTMESVASLFTGLDPPAHGSSYINEEPGFVPSKLKTLAEMFRGAGYVTALVTHQLLFVGNIGYEQGFDLSSWGDIEDALRFVEQNADRPFFLILYEANPHHPYDPAPEYNRFLPPGADKVDPKIWQDSDVLRKGVRTPEELAVLEARYDGEIRQNDRTVLKPLWDKLGQLGLVDKTLFVFTADHGEAFGEHASEGVGTWHQSTYEEVIRVPLVFSCPALFEPREVDQPVGLIDVYPTLADLLGLKADPRVQGRSLKPLLCPTGPPPSPPPYYSHMSSGGAWTSFRTDRWKLVTHEHGAVKELFDLTADPTEQIDVAAQHPDIAAELERQCRERVDQSLALRKTLGAPPGQASKEQLDKLKTLGYLN